jgi:hypothetical protein
LRRSLRPFGGVVDMQFEPAGLRLQLAVTLPQVVPEAPAAPAPELSRPATAISARSASPADLR